MPAIKGPTRFGFVHLPLHTRSVNPTLQLQRDLQLVEFAEELGYDEVFIGEHHSVGNEIICSPEMFLAAAAQRTKRIRLGTGVVSVPYHHPFHVAQRAVFLDHLSQGRAILGLGPGSLTSDAIMLGLDVAENRRKLAEGMDVIIRLLEGEVVTETTDWYTMDEAQLQMRPYQLPNLELLSVSVASPVGAKNAGKYGIGMLNLAALSPRSFEALRGHWEVVEYEAEKSGRPCSRDSWRLSGFMHFAETLDQARQDLQYGFLEVVDYIKHFSLGAPLEGETVDEVLDSALEAGMLIIGGPEAAIEVIDKLTEQTGGFGSFCLMLADFVPYAAQRRALELFSEYVIPHYRGQLAPRQKSYDWVRSRHSDNSARHDAVVAATAEYAAERGQTDSSSATSWA